MGNAEVHVWSWPEEMAHIYTTVTHITNSVCKHRMTMLGAQ